MGVAVAFLLSLSVSVFADQASGQVRNRYEELQKEDLRSIQTAFRKANLNLSRIYVHDKRTINADYSVIAVSGVVPKQTPPLDAWFGVFVIYGTTNQIYLTLDVARSPQCCAPRLLRATEEAIYVDWIGDYGFYGGTRKYTYNLAKRHAPERYDYRRFAARSAHTKRNVLAFAGTYSSTAEIDTADSPDNIMLSRSAFDGKWRVDSLAVGAPEKRSSPSPLLPRVLKALSDSFNGNAPDPSRTIDAGDGLWLYVVPGSNAGSSGQTSGVHLFDLRGKGRFFPVPAPTIELYENLRRKPGNEAFLPGPAPEGLGSAIGPFAYDGERLWFASDFYDGEGSSGVGAVGSFHVATRKYEMRYLPEIAPWSASTLMLDGDDVWIGLMRQPEGAAYGAGVFRFNKQTEAARKYAMDDLVSVIVRNGSQLYFGASDGVYVLNDQDQQWAHIRIEPGRKNPRQIVTEALTFP